MLEVICAIFGNALKQYQFIKIFRIRIIRIKTIFYLLNGKRVLQIKFAWIIANFLYKNNFNTPL